MNYLIFSLLALFCTSWAMDDRPTKELVKKQLQLDQQMRDITFNGDIDAFNQNREMFQKELAYQDLDVAKLLCEFRLSAVAQLITMRTNARINSLVQAMKKEIEESGRDYHNYIDKAEATHKKDHTLEEMDAAADILCSIVRGSGNPTGRYFSNLQKKIACEQNPDQFLEKQKANSTALLNALKEVMAEEWEPAPEEEEYDEDKGCGIAWIPHRKKK